MSFNDDDYYLLHKGTKTVERNLGKKSVPMYVEPNDHLKEYLKGKEDTHTIMRGMKARSAGYSSKLHTESTVDEAMMMTKDYATRSKNHIEQELANNDINSDVDRFTVKVHKSNVAKTKKYLQKLGYTNHSVIPGLNEGEHAAKKTVMVMNNDGKMVPRKQAIKRHNKMKPEIKSPLEIAESAILLSKKKKEIEEALDIKIAQYKQLIGESDTSPFNWKSYKSQVDWSRDDKNTSSEDGVTTHKASDTKPKKDPDAPKKSVGRPKGKYGSYLKADKRTAAEKQAIADKVHSNPERKKSYADAIAARREFKDSMNKAIKDRQEEINKGN